MITCPTIKNGSSLVIVTPTSHAERIKDVAACFKDRTVLYIALNKSPRMIQKILLASGVRKEDLFFIAPGMTMNGEDVMQMQSQGDLTELSLMLTKALTKRPPAIVIFDGVPTLSFYTTMETLMRFVKFTVDKLRLTNTPGVFIATDDEFAKKTSMFYDNQIGA